MIRIMIMCHITYLDIWALYVSQFWTIANSNYLLDTKMIFTDNKWKHTQSCVLLTTKICHSRFIDLSIHEKHTFDISTSNDLRLSFHVPLLCFPFSNMHYYIFEWTSLGISKSNIYSSVLLNSCGGGKDQLVSLVTS